MAPGSTPRGFTLPHRRHSTSALRTPASTYGPVLCSPPLLDLLLRLVSLLLVVLQCGGYIRVRLRRWHFAGLCARVWSGWQTTLALILRQRFQSSINLLPEMVIHLL